MKKVWFVLAAFVAMLAISLPGAFARTDTAAAPAAVPGISRTSITIGGSFPLSGPVSSYAPIARGMEAYFKWANQRRGTDKKLGVYGRKIDFKILDDAYNPANTVQTTNQLVLQDKVFAIVGTLGTEPNLAIRPFLNQRKVPQILVSTGASYFGLQYKEFPWTIGWQPDYIATALAYGKWIVQNAPNAKIAVFYQNDDYGKDYLKGLKIGLAAKRSLIVSELGYEVTDTSYASQIARQKATGADTWVLLTTAGTPTVRALATGKALNFRPDNLIINDVAATDGVMRAAVASVGAEYVSGAISSGYLKNPTNPKYANDATVRKYRTILANFGPSGADPNNTFYYYGMAKAYDAIRLLYLAGKNPTRASLMRATQHMNWVNPFMIAGVRVKTGPQDRFPLSQIKLARYTNGSWTEFGNLLKGR
jgi:branched-chain amino acid transport system substrate-binding protein